MISEEESKEIIDHKKREICIKSPFSFENNLLDK